MKAKITIASLLLCIICRGLFAQPLVYSTENTGAGCAPPPLPSISQLPVIQPLPDPFLWANGSGRSTSFSDWECHRNEFKAQIENYEIGIKPPKPDSITASYTSTSATAGTLTVIIKRNGQTMTLTSAVALPSVAGPWPAVIGMNSSSGSVPATVFTSRNIARITFSHDQVTTYGNPALTNPFYRLYPEYNLVNSGQYSAWAWGVSRIIDGLELVQASLPIKLNKIGVTGCSYAGKMALYSGAFDERIALTIAQESGGGGAPSWRASHNLEPNGTVEKIDNTDYRWFKDSMVQFAGDNVYKLPHDHHELMAMVAPRALLVTGNTGFTWLSNQANYVTSRATKSIYSTLGISDRFGFYIDGDHNHCAVPTTQVPAMQAFVDKFLADIPNVITDTMTVNPFPLVNYQRWYQWWGTGNAVLPPLPGRNVWLEAECATIGSNWNTVSDTSASNGKYVSVGSGLSSTATPPTNSSAYVVMPFTVDSAATYNFVSRLYSTAGQDYSFWVKLDTGAFQSVSSVLLNNGGFESGLSGWSIFNAAGGATLTATNVAGEVRTGTGALKVVNPTARPGNQWMVQLSSSAFPTTIGKQYVISYWVKAANPGGSIRLSTGPTGAQYQGDQAIGTSWQQVSWTITASLSSTTIVFDMAQVANTYYIDDASVQEAGTGGGWQWIKLRDAALSAGAHTLTFAYRDGSPKLDKVQVTTFSTAVTDLGGTATNCATVCNTALGSRLYVDTAATGGGNGATWGCAFKQLYDAFAYANTHPEISEIWVSRGIYTPRNNGNRGENFGLNRYGIRVVGGFSGTETTESQANTVANPTILSGDVGVAGNSSDNSLHLFIFYNPAYSGALVFKGLTMQNTRAGDVGGVAYVAYLNNLTFDNCTFKNNYAPTGGAFYIDNTNVIYNNCSFEGNSATTGGSIYTFQASPVFNKCMFINNTGSAGGAYYGNYGQPMFRDVVFTRNTSISDGGAVYQNTMSADYMNCVLDSNMAQGIGGAIFVHNGGKAGLLNSTLHGNRANNSGGAVFADYNGAGVIALNTIFWGNSRNGNTAIPGNDVDAYDFTASTFRSSMMQQNSKVPADNGTTRINNMWGTAPAFMKESSTMGADMVWRTSDDGLQLACSGTGSSIVVPVVCGAGINSGDNSLATANSLTADIMGNSRIVCITIDRGAYELQSCNSLTTYTDEAKSIGKSLVAGQANVEDIAIVANPFSTQLQVRYVGNNKASIAITSATGKVMAQKNNLSSGTHSFDATMWGKGLYNVVLVSETGKKIVIKAIRL